MRKLNTLFVSVIAAILLVISGCGGVYLSVPTPRTDSSNATVAKTGSITIPLRSSTRKPTNAADLCTRFEFKLTGTKHFYEAEGVTSVEFPAIAYDTYLLNGIAYGTLSEEPGAPEVAVAYCAVKNIEINSPEPKTLTLTFKLTEAAKIYLHGYTVEETREGSESTFEVTYTDTDKGTIMAETETQSDGSIIEREFAINAEGANEDSGDGTLAVTKVKITEQTETEGTVTVTVTIKEWDTGANEDSQPSKVTVTTTANDVTTVTTSEFNLDTAEDGCGKRVTTESGNTTTVDKYDSNEATEPTEREVTLENPESNTTKITTYNNSDMDHPASVIEIETNAQGEETQTTTTYDPAQKATGVKDTIVVEITIGTNAGQKTITKYDTENVTDPAQQKKESVTEIAPDNTGTVSEFASDEYNSLAKTIQYQEGYNPDSSNSTLHVASTIEYTRENGALTQSKTTSFEYESDMMTAVDVENQVITPYAKKTEEVCDPAGTLLSTKVTEFTYADETSMISTETVTEMTGTNKEVQKTTTTEYSLDQAAAGGQKRITVEEGNTTTVSRYASNTDAVNAPVEKDVTEVSAEATTITYYDDGNMTYPAKEEVIESDKTTTTVYTENSATRATVTVENTDGSGSVSTFNSNDKIEKKVETTAENVPTITKWTYSSSSASKETKYTSGWDPDSSENAEPNDYHIARSVEITGNTTVTSEFTYTSIETIDKNGTRTIPYSTKTVTTETESGTPIIRTTSYEYNDDGRPTNVITVDPANPSNEIAFEKYQYKADGTPNTVAIKEEGQTAKYYSYRPIGLKVYSDTAMTGTIIFQSTGTTFFECPCSNDSYNDPDASKIPQQKIADYLTDNYVLVGSSIATTASGTEDLHFITTDEISKAKTAGFNYIFKVNFTGFLSTGCFTKGSIVSEGTGTNQCFYLKCYLHNDKASCSNFWGANHNYYSASYIIKDTNYGSLGNGQGIGN